MYIRFSLELKGQAQFSHWMRQSRIVWPSNRSILENRVSLIGNVDRKWEAKNGTEAPTYI